ncbi:oligosaccharide flippase family protein [Mucilaginibacter antarcticus]|uniref:oligosaccharide flippase family protein n=1 Tax=Mucilaginibacter antarcticus TaxID=1855725 RepID=UPI00362E0276
MKIIDRSKKYVSGVFNSNLVKNSSWGILSQLSQTVFLSLFFVILARKYPTPIFAKYIVANAIYQLVTAFSTMGLGQWFIREFISAENKPELTSKFLKMQTYFGVSFFALNIGLAYLLYDDQYTRILIILLGSNVIFDNIINAIKSLNVAMFEQKKTFIILTIETFIKFLAGCVLYIYPFDIITLSIILIALRFITLNLFLTVGSSNVVNIKMLLKYKILYADVKKLIVSNWAFIIIGGVSIINWRLANIVISKMLTPFDVANYEISFKIFNIAQILPVVVSTSVFPMLVKLYNDNDPEKFKMFYKKMHLYYMLFGLFSYTFIYSFSGLLVPLVFGNSYLSNAHYTQQMFLTILVFPTVLLQANMLITINLEKLDMLFNIFALIINFTICIVGLTYVKSLSMVNYSIFASFLIFHISQDVIMIKNKLTSVMSAVSFI